MLYHIADDPTEHHDLAAQHPDIVSQMLARLQQLRASEWHDPQWPPTASGEPPTRCDTPTGDCSLQKAQMKAAAAKKGCIDVWM